MARQELCPTVGCRALAGVHKKDGQDITPQEKNQRTLGYMMYTHLDSNTQGLYFSLYVMLI